MEKRKFDLIVIGGGPGGYPAAIRGAQYGKSVALIEAKEMGGTCLNRGCIPSKALIANAEIWHSIQESEEFGISLSNASFSYDKMVARKNRIVNNLRKGLEGVISSNGITVFRGYGKFVAPNEIKVIGKDNALLSADKIIIATGSEPKSITAFPYDYEKIHDSTSLLEMKEIPKSIVIVGGGIIGCEFASLYSLLGVDVTILELLPKILPMEENSISGALTKALKKRGVNIHTGVQVDQIEKTKAGITAKLSDGKTFKADIALIAIGRALNTSSIGLEKAGIVPKDNGMIPVDKHMQTEVSGIYAVGDIASKWWLAHVASHQGLVAASHACGYPSEMHYNAVPNVVFTYPEIATVGLSLEEALKQGYSAKLGSFPAQALGKAQAIGETDGFAQIVFDKKTGQILGAQIVGHDASSLISEMAVAIANELTIECITETIHAHPTLPEAWLEAAFLGLNMPLHINK